MVWSGSDGNDFEIYAYDIGSQLTVQLTNDSGDDIGAQVANGIVVWQGWDGSGLRDLPVGRQHHHQAHRQRAARRATAHRRARQRRVAGEDGFDLEIFYWDGAAVHRVTDNVADDANPEIHDGTIVWQGYDGRDFEIYRLQIP